MPITVIPPGRGISQPIVIPQQRRHPLEMLRALQDDDRGRNNNDDALMLALLSFMSGERGRKQEGDQFREEMKLRTKQVNDAATRDQNQFELLFQQGANQGTAITNTGLVQQSQSRTLDDQIDRLGRLEEDALSERARSRRVDLAQSQIQSKRVQAPADLEEMQETALAGFAKGSTRAFDTFKDLARAQGTLATSGTIGFKEMRQLSSALGDPKTLKNRFSEALSGVPEAERAGMATALFKVLDQTESSLMQSDFSTAADLGFGQAKGRGVIGSLVGGFVDRATGTPNAQKQAFVNAFKDAKKSLREIAGDAISPTFETDLRARVAKMKQASVKEIATEAARLQKMIDPPGATTQPSATEQAVEEFVQPTTAPAFDPNLSLPLDQRPQSRLDDPALLEALQQLGVFA